MRQPTLIPLGDRALLVRYADGLSDAANSAALSLARRLQSAPLPGVVEVVPNLVSVLLRYDPVRISFAGLSAEVRLTLSTLPERVVPGTQQTIGVEFGGDAGPDLDSVAQSLQLDPMAFVRAHNAHPLRVLAIGFAPGFAYCGFHPENLHLPRRKEVRPLVPAGSILFAAGQTAITATPIPTGWHVIGRTAFRNFDALADVPVRLQPGDRVVFTEGGE